MHPLLMHLVHHGEARYVSAVLKAVKSWFLPGTAVPDEPHSATLYLVKEGQVLVGRAAPPEASVFHRGADLRLVEDFQPLAVKEP